MPSLCGVIAMALALVQISDAAAVGFAIEKTGRWLVQGGSVKQAVEVELGVLLPSRGVVVPVRGTRESAAKLVVALHDGTVVTFTQEGVLPSRTQSAGAFARIWNVMLGRFTPRLINALSRGSELPDTILERSGDTLTLTPILASIPRTARVLRLQPLGPEGKPSGSPLPTLRISGQDSVEVVGLSSGLFELAALRAANNAEPIATSWVQVCEGAECERIRRALASAQQMIESWGDQVRESTKRAALRAVLAGLE